jgi:hypothetical protein
MMRPVDKVRFVRVRHWPRDGALEKVPMFARVDAPQILFLAAASILIVGIARLF